MRCRKIFRCVAVVALSAGSGAVAAPATWVEQLPQRIAERDAAVPDQHRSIRLMPERQRGGGDVIRAIRDRGLLRVGISQFQPWAVCDTTGELIGYEVDVARRIASDIGVELRLVRIAWPYIIPALIEKQFDLIVSGMSITPQRNLLVNFSSPYSEFGTAVVANTALTADLTTQEDFNEADVVFGAYRGTTPVDAIEEHFPNATLRLFDSGSAVMQAVVAGNVHAAAVDQISAAAWVRDNADMLRRPFEQLFNRIPEAIALRRGDPDSLNFLNGWIERYRTIGWLGSRRHYWFETAEWMDQIATDPQVQERCAATFGPNPY